MRTIDREELVRAVQSGSVTLVEVMPPEYYERAHLPGALNLPGDAVARLAPSLLPDKRAAIVTYGLNFTWQAAQQAIRELISMGYSNVREYEEGKQDWVAAGLPLEGKKLDEPIPKTRPSEFVGHLNPARQAVRQQPPKV